MKGFGKLYWLPVLALLVVCLAACVPPTAVDCHGDLHVEQDEVARVTPSPRDAYQVSQTYTWDVPPYGVEVTSGGEAVMQIYAASNTLLAKYTIYAATSTTANVSVKKWDGLSEITFDAGNFIVEDSDSQDICNLDLFAGGVGITSVGTKYVITVRPEINEVTVAVLDGAVMLTSLEKTVTLDADIPSESMVVINNGIIGPLLPIPARERLLEDIMTGKDIQHEPQGPALIEGPQQPQDQAPLTLWADERLLPVLQEIAASFTKDTGIEVQIMGMPILKIRDQYAEALKAGVAPDLVTLPHWQIYTLVKEGKILPVELDESYSDQLLPGTIQAFRYMGETYGVPYVYDNLALVSNLDLVPDIPDEWWKFRPTATATPTVPETPTSTPIYSMTYYPSTPTKSLPSSPTNTPTSTVQAKSTVLLMIPEGGDYFNGGDYFFPIQSAFGGYIFGTDEHEDFTSSDLGMSSSGSLNAASWYSVMVQEERVVLGSEEEALQMFQKWNTAMIVTGPSSLPRLRKMGVRFQVNSFPPQEQDSTPFLRVYGFLISSNSQAKDAAQNLLWNYLTTYEAVDSYSKLTATPPARQDVLDNLKDEELKAFGFAGVNGIPRPYIPEMDLVWVPWSNAIRDIYDNKMNTHLSKEEFLNANDTILQEIQNMYP